MIVQPGQEAYLCYFVTLPGTAQVDVGALQSWMSPVGSQDLIVHARDAAGDAGGVAVPSGTLQSCATRGGSERVLHWAAEPGAVVSAYMPQGVGTSLAAGSQLVLSMHFSNAGCSPLTPKVKLNLLYAKNIQYQAGLLVSFNTSIDVPAATALGPGTQTVTGTCQAPAGSKFFIATTHTNGRATAAAIDIVSGGQSAEIVHTGPAPSYPADQEPGSGADWQRPGVGLWTAPNFLTVNAGDSFAYRCSYSNTGNKAVAVGETIADEMCATVMYYYPAGVATCN
jgi:hypothetical protein